MSLEFSNVKGFRQKITNFDKIPAAQPLGIALARPESRATAFAIKLRRILNDLVGGKI
jgi:hypothetical protein